MQNRLLKIALCAAIAAPIALLSGCNNPQGRMLGQVIKTNSPIELQLVTTPAGAKYTVVNNSGQVMQQGKTPDQYLLPVDYSKLTGTPYKITFKKFGYVTRTVVIQTPTSVHEATPEVIDVNMKTGVVQQHYQTP